MKTKMISVLAVVIAAGGAYGYYQYQQKAKAIVHLTPEKVKELKAETAKQNEQAFTHAVPQAREIRPANANKNVYFGDMHIHTALSFDSYLFGNRVGLEDAYRFANGEAIINAAGEKMQLAQPLDFAAVTDHAESFGMFEACGQPNLNKAQREFCATFDAPSLSSFLELRRMGEQRPPQRPTAQCNDKLDSCMAFAKTTWQKMQAAAEKYNKPGEFTTFSAYEYSPPLPQRGKMHRNVFFKNSQVPQHATSAFDAASVLDLWRSLEQDCTGECEFLTIPHNMNKSWGIAYSGKTIDGDNYTQQDWALRKRSEPLAEMFQIKGNSECRVGAGSSDEECEFEQITEVCTGEEKNGCSGPNSYVREGLKKGLVLQEELGFNPLQVGMIGSTDTHNGSPGDTEEWDYRGANGLYGSPAKTRLGLLKKNMDGRDTYKKGVSAKLNPGGLAAVWAPENTRNAIFTALQNRETYATSGTRIKLRFFGGWDLGEKLDGQQLLSNAYQHGVPMGGVLNQANANPAPEFLAWAMADNNSSKLQKIQVIKGWVEGGKSREQVYDIACSDGLKPDPASHRCPDNNAQVNLNDCSFDNSKGAAEIKTLWRDPNYNKSQAAFYYVRVLQNPSCRWSTYDALRLGVEPRKDIPATIKERAWSSPIWVNP